MSAIPLAKIGTKGCAVLEWRRTRRSNFPDIHASRKHPIALWQVTGARVVRIDFGDGVCPVSGLDWSDPTKVFSTGLSASAKPGSYKYTIVLADAEGVETIIDPQMIIDP